MQGAVRQSAVYLSGNIHRRKVKIISAAGGEGKLLVNRLFNRQRNVCEITCVIGIIITVALLAEHLEGIVARCKVAGNRYACRAACAVLSDLSVVKYIVIAVAKQDGNILIAVRFRAGIGNLYGAARRCCNSLIARYGKAAAAVPQRQLPLVSAVFGNRGQPSVGLSAHGGRCKKDRVQI